VCPNCGAAATADAGRYCSFCGAMFPDVELSPLEYATHPQRFAAAKARPDYGGALEEVPPRPPLTMDFLMPAGMCVFGALFLSSWFSMTDGEMSAFGAVFGVIWFGALGKPVVTGLWRRFAPLHHALGVLVEQTSDGEDDDADYWMTFQLEDGARVVLRATSRVAAALTTRDIGVLHRRGQSLAGFHRLGA
jgi:hypothetical protein